jgi:preprotein translocase subunit SecE
MQIIAKTKKFLQEVKSEFKKVSWSTKDELIGSTSIVIISVAALAIFIGICDFIFAKVVNIIIR